MDASYFSDLELRAYTLIKASVCSKQELEEYYTLDEFLKLYALYSMDRDCERGMAAEMEERRDNY